MEEIVSYFTYANMQTPIGRERLNIIRKLLRSYHTYEEAIDLHLDLHFYENELKEKPNARYMVFGIVEKHFGFGIYSEKEVKEGKLLSKIQYLKHEYLHMDAFIIKILCYMENRPKKKGIFSPKPGIGLN